MLMSERGRRAARIVIAVFTALLSGVTVYQMVIDAPTGLRPSQKRATTGVASAVAATTSTGRSGAYYLPPSWESAALPVMVALHGTGGSGSGMLTRLRPIAESTRFIVVAPDSVSVAGAWLVTPGPQGVTEDHRHVMASVNEVLALRGVQVDRARTLVAGFSVGGGAAAYLASHEDLFTAFGVLHGHVPVADLGARRVRGWLSTGTADRQRTAADVRATADDLRRVRDFADVETCTFPGGHTVSEDEIAALVSWWLQRPDRPPCRSVENGG